MKRDTRAGTTPKQHARTHTRVRSQVYVSNKSVSRSSSPSKPGGGNNSRRTVYGTLVSYGTVVSYGTLVTCLAKSTIIDNRHTNTMANNMSCGVI